MVFCGKPSKGCYACRERKIRCDQLPDGCSQCVKISRDCPGYRNPVDVIFRNESRNVVSKAKAQEARDKKAFIRSAKSSGTPAALDPVGTPLGECELQGKNLVELVRQNDRDSPSFSPYTSVLAPTIEERAVGFFFTHYVIGINGPTRGHLEHLRDLYNTNEVDDNLLASINAVGIAGFSHRAHAPQLMKNAWQEYTKALRLTNEALLSATTAKKDSTLLAIQILSIYETVTGCNQRSLKAWAEHINGAAALVKLRGLEQMRTPAGRRMFIQVCSSLLISCIQRRLPMPVHILELRAEAAKHVQTTEPAWLVQDAMIAFADFRSRTRSGALYDPQIILCEALEIDGTFITLFSDVPPGWEYKTFYTDDNSDIVFNGLYHVYYDYWLAQLWNAMRTVRIFLNEQIRELILAGLSSKPPFFLGPEYTAQLQVSTDALFQLQVDILATVPQHVGYTPRHAASSSSSGMGSASSSQGSPADFLWSGFQNTTTDYLSSSVPPDLGFPTVRASGGYFLMWPLFLVGSMDITTAPIRPYVIRLLRYIGREMGIQQSALLSEMLEKREEVRVWYETEKTETKTGLPVCVEVG